MPRRKTKINFKFSNHGFYAYLTKSGKAFVTEVAEVPNGSKSVWIRTNRPKVMITLRELLAQAIRDTIEYQGVDDGSFDDALAECEALAYILNALRLDPDYKAKREKEDKDKGEQGQEPKPSEE